MIAWFNSANAVRATIGAFSLLLAAGVWGLPRGKASRVRVGLISASAMLLGLAQFDVLPFGRREALSMAVSILLMSISLGAILERRASGSKSP